MNCFERLVRELEARRPAALVTVLRAPPAFSLAPGHKLLVGPDGVLAGGDADADVTTALAAAGLAALEEERAGSRQVNVRGETVRVYVEPYTPPPVLVVVGGGHVGQALARMAKPAGFDVWVLDDRPEYANDQLFPTADRVVCAPFIEGLDRFNLGPAHYVVLVTRGHHYDMRCLRHVIQRPVRYIGMIGSRTRVDTVFRMLQENDGIDPSALKKVHAPIGLDIGARTPAEIAVSILGELIKVRRGGTGISLSQLERARIHDPRAGREENR